MRSRFSNKGLKNFKNPYKICKREMALVKVKKSKPEEKRQYAIPIEQNFQRILGEQEPYEHSWQTYEEIEQSDNF